MAVIRAKERGKKSQSAMEYLLTYGWAILIISVVLGVMYSLGIFNFTNLVSKAGAGLCSVYRPGGQGTQQLASLVGDCAGLLPQSVAQFSGTVSYINATNAAMLNVQTGDFAATAWYNAVNTNPYVLVDKDICGNSGGWYTGVSFFRVIGSSSVTLVGNTLSQNAWHFVVGVKSGGNLYYYQDGILTASGAAPGGVTNINNPIELGARPGSIVNPSGCGRSFMNGQIANVQIYNTSLSASDVQYLYQKGIGGVPILLQNLVGWWPLNGDANDYSGNNNNGVFAANVIYSTSWMKS